VLLIYSKYTVIYGLKLISLVITTRDINNEKTTHVYVQNRNKEVRKTGDLKKT
jgi:hypothetical protein